METQETKRCPYCGEEILAVAKKCKHCGSWLTEESNVSTKTITCPACGENVKEGTKCCPHCGEAIEQVNTEKRIPEKSKEKTPTPKKSNNNTIVLLSILGLILVIGIVIFATQNNKNNNSNESGNATPIVDTVGVASVDGNIDESPLTNWEKDYGQNEYGEEDKSDAMISQTFHGKSDRSDCDLKIIFSTTDGLIFVVSGQYVNFTDCKVKAKVGDKEFELSPTMADESVIYFQGENSIQTMINLLECGEMFKISITNNDAANNYSHFIFEIFGDTEVTKHLLEIGVDAKATSL